MTNRVDDAFKNNNQATMKQSDKRWVTSLSLSKPRMGLILRAMHWDRLKLSLYIKLFYIYELFSTPSSSLSVYRHCCGIIAIVITGISHWEKEGEREGERKWRKKKKEKWLFQRNRLISVGETSQTAVCDVMEMIDCIIPVSSRNSLYVLHLRDAISFPHFAWS